MSGLQVIGYPTQNTFLNMESHKLHLAFGVAAAVVEGQPVKLNAAGLITPMVAGDNGNLCIGVAIMAFDPALINSPTQRHVECTVAMRGYSVIIGEVGATAITAAGPVVYTGFNSTSKRHKFISAGAGNPAGTPPVYADNPIGIALEPGATGDEIDIVYI